MSVKEVPPVDKHYVEQSEGEKKISKVRLIGLFGGVILGAIVYFLIPRDAVDIITQSVGADVIEEEEMNVGAVYLVAGIAVMMAIWWMTEAISLAATAMVPLVLFPLLGINDYAGTAGSYASDTIYLFMGGFILAIAMQRWHFDRRVALGIVRIVGVKPRRLVLGFMIATGFISMWVSNTATAVMMLPIGLSVIQLFESAQDKNAAVSKGLDVEAAYGGAIHGGVMSGLLNEGDDVASTTAEKHGIKRSNFAVGLMLAIAYSASIGSLATPIGTPPNTLLKAYMSDTLHYDINFGKWFLMGLPMVIVFTLFAWWILTFVMFKPEIEEIPGGKELINEEYAKLGKLRGGELLVMLLFILAVFCWIFVPLILKATGIEGPKKLDAIVAMSVAVLLFIIPGKKNGERLVTWNEAKTIPWDILLLFGGGLSLSKQFQHTGLSNYIGEMVKGLAGAPIVIIVLAVAALVLALTELTSNTATAAAFLPIIGGVATGIGLDGPNVMILTIPAALAATCAFMLPVATPPNAIAYGSGYLKIADMIKGGFIIALVGLVLITITVFALAIPIFGLALP